ncbi:3-hydroxyacyl-CoA dehydrogenase NAD-binding domain-containing protein [Roseibium salinum]|nr:3-hydroxyacyl-CoA dehydrogenase NAD-binding domain-containing protein [Roseibium salinum]
MAGLSVVLVEREAEFADKARQTIARNLAGAVERNKLSQEAHGRILNERLKTVVGYDALSNADIIIEAVFLKAWTSRRTSSTGWTQSPRLARRLPPTRHIWT